MSWRYGMPFKSRRRTIHIWQSEQDPSWAIRLEEYWDAVWWYEIEVLHHTAPDDPWETWGWDGPQHVKEKIAAVRQWIQLYRRWKELVQR